MPRIRGLLKAVAELERGRLAASASPASKLADQTEDLETSELRRLAKDSIEIISEQQRPDVAWHIARSALDKLARLLIPSFRARRSYGYSVHRPTFVDAELTTRIARLAAELPKIEALHYVTSIYPALLPDRTRSALGAFYTPPSLAARLVEQATECGVDWQRAQILDPAAGGGAFLLQAICRIREASTDLAPSMVLASIGARLSAFELDPRAADLAQAAVDILTADLSLSCGRSVPKIVRVCDALEEVPVERFDLVVGNPPYGRISLRPEQRRRYRRSLYGHANLYGVFTDLALRWAKAEGHIAYLTPASFLAGQYFQSLRKLLADEAPPQAIEFIHSRRDVFEDVLQETLLATYRKGRPRGSVRIRYLMVNTAREIRLEENGSINLPRNPALPWLAPRYAEHSKLIRRAERMQARLRDWGYGVSTGPLVWNRYKGQLSHTSVGANIYPLIWAEAVTSDGRFCFRAQKKNHLPYFRVGRHDQWLLTKHTCVLVQRTTAKEQARRLIAAELPAKFVKHHGAVVIENHLNMIKPVQSARVRPALIASLLNSRILDQLFRCMNGSVAVSAFELEALPLPSAEHLHGLEQLLLMNSDQERIEAECTRLYTDAM
jgi:adenine-specific DNA-methyltransferase